MKAAVDRRCGVTHNHPLESVDPFIKAFPSTLPLLCTDNAGRNRVYLQRSYKTPSKFPWVARYRTVRKIKTLIVDDNDAIRTGQVQQPAHGDLGLLADQPLKLTSTQRWVDVSVGPESASCHSLRSVLGKFNILWREIR